MQAGPSSKYIFIFLAVLILGGLLVDSILVSRVSHVDTKYDKVRGDINALTEALQLYKKDYGEYPKDLNELVKKQSKGHLDRLPKDPWGRSYHYQYPGIHNENSFDLSSYGEDGEPGGNKGNQDITNWK
jgi:general secretion pathway protein G